MGDLFAVSRSGRKTLSVIAEAVINVHLQQPTKVQNDKHEERGCDDVNKGCFSSESWLRTYFLAMGGMGGHWKEGAAWTRKKGK